MVELTDRECKALAELSKQLDLPQDRVLIQALRHYQVALNPNLDHEPIGCPGDFE